MAREMKDSGVQWVGAIPKSWKTIKFKYLHDGLNTGEAIDKNFWSTEESDRVFYTAGVFPIRTNYESFPAWKLTTENDLLLARNGTPYVYSPKTGACYTDHIIRAIMKKGINKRYVQYSLQQSIASVVIDTVSIATWSASLWNEQSIAWPSNNEQSSIVAYLDIKCAEIDTVLEKTRISIEEYKRLKQAIIIQAVTKGVRGDRPMKESGVIWLGSVPADWDISKIKHTIFPHEKPISPADDVITCFRDGTVTLRKNRREEGFTISFSEHGYQGVDVGDLVIHGMDTFAGAIGCSDSRGKTSPVVHVCSTVGNNRYFMYFLRYMAYSNVLMDFSNGVRIRSSDFRNFNKLGVFEILIPPLEEQDEIVDYLDSEILKIEQMISKKGQFLMDVEGYKKSLIYEYVTGKRR